jgi:LPXTG-site transpeptidase (sortase) family protein
LRKLSKQKIILAGLAIGSLVALSCFIWIYKTSLKVSEAPLAANVITINPIVITNPPIRLRIPSLSIDANIEYVSATPDGSMDVPKVASDAAWFDLGPHPGEIGSSVIDGHSGYKDNRPAVFDNLYKLQKGDKVYVQDASGETTTFVVQDFKSYDQSSNASSVFTSSDGLAHLNLITCNGIWNPKLGTHSSRLVVFTNKLVI